MELKNKTMPAGSFAIESALVVPIVLISVISMLLFGFKLHDLVMENMVVNESAELCTRLPKTIDMDSIESYGNERLQGVIGKEGQKLLISSTGNFPDEVSITSEKGTRNFDINDVRPEKMMRMITVLEGLNDNE